MKTNEYLSMLVEDFHSSTVATIGADGRPQTRVIDMMLWEEAGVYFLTAKGKEFYRQLMEQQYIALSATKDKRSVSLRGKIRNIGAQKLDEIFLKNTYMQKIYPGDTKAALEVFQIYQGEGEYFDLSQQPPFRQSFSFGGASVRETGYRIRGEKCIGCQGCHSVCPSGCISGEIPRVIDESRCLHCGNCFRICPVQAVEKLGEGGAP